MKKANSILKKRRVRPKPKIEDIKGLRGDKITIDESKAIDEMRQKTPCKCGHLLSGHSRFINGKFVGCQIKGCKCEKFEWEL